MSSFGILSTRHSGRRWQLRSRHYQVHQPSHNRADNTPVFKARSPSFLYTVLKNRPQEAKSCTVESRISDVVRIPKCPLTRIRAYVPVFVGVDGHEAAAFKAVSGVTSCGFSFIDIADGQIHDLDLHNRDAVVIEALPNFVAEFLAQSKMIETLRTKFILSDHVPSMRRKRPGYCRERSTYVEGLLWGVTGMSRPTLNFRPGNLLCWNARPGSDRSRRYR